MMEYMEARMDDFMSQPEPTLQERLRDKTQLHPIGGEKMNHVMRRLGVERVEAADALDAHEATIADLHGLLVLSSDEKCRLETDLANLQVDASIADATIAALVEALGKAAERLDASLFTNAEHAQAREIIRAALK